MALIKNSQCEALVREAIVLDLGDLRRQGDELVAGAKRRAAEIIKDAEGHRERLIRGAAEQGREEGHRAGLEAGRAEGLEKGRAEGLEQAKTSLAALEQAWTKALASFEASRDEMLGDARADVLTLAVSIAERVTKRVVAHDPKVVRGQIESALAALLKATRLTVAVHPDDHAEAAAALPGLLARYAQSAHAELVQAQEVGRGSCIVRTERGEIDATIATQLERIVEALTPREVGAAAGADAAAASDAPAAPDAGAKPAAGGA